MQELTFGTLINRALKGWATAAAFAALAIMFSLASLVGSKPVYRVSMTVVPAPSDQGASSVNAGGALSTLLGIGGAGGNVNFSRYQRLLSATVVAQHLQDKYGMLQKVYSAYWDADRKVWVRPPATLREILTGWLLYIANLPTWSPPDINALASYLQGQLTVLPSPTSDIVTISMDSRDVTFARTLMLAAHTEANAVLRDQVAHRARLQVAYLQEKLAQTSVQDYRATLLSMLGNQEKILMLTQTDASYAAEILSPPTASSTPVAPRPVLTAFVAALAGALTGIAVAIFFGPEWWRQILTRIRNRRAGNKSYSTQT